MTTEQLPRFVRDLLSAPPRAGQGVNLYLFRLARVLHAYRTEREILAMLRASVAGCGREVGEQEILRAVENSRRVAWQPGVANGPARPASASLWPPREPARRAAVVAQGDGFTLADLWESSPVRFDDDEPQAEAVIDALFPGDPLLCCGQSKSLFATRRRSRWRGRLAGLALIVPSPMTSRTGRTQDGRVSQHTLANTGPRRYLIIEQDGGTPDEQAAILAHLGHMAPLTLVVHSGRRSLHGWYHCAGRAEAETLALMRYAYVLGADRATWTRSQFVRIPDGLRDNGQRQYILYLDPEPALNAEPCAEEGREPEARRNPEPSAVAHLAREAELPREVNRNPEAHAATAAHRPPAPRHLKPEPPSAGDESNSEARRNPKPFLLANLTAGAESRREAGSNNESRPGSAANLNPASPSADDERTPEPSPEALRAREAELPSHAARNPDSPPTVSRRRYVLRE
ncbi:MAG: hypothetical protein J0I10_14995 [Verrucomicrobia bacterium]|nr:hypothetical protein [Verrucomicrobiota bacterium]